MIGVLISFLVAVLVCYALYNALGYYDEYKRESTIKDIENLISDAKKVLTKEEFIIKNDEIETEIIRGLDQKSQENLLKINEIVSSSFYLSDFKNFFNINYSNLLKFIHERKEEEVEKLVNNQIMTKIRNLSEQKIKDLNLIKIIEIKILSIDLDSENNYVIIRNEIISDEMISSDSGKNFVTKRLTRIVEYANSIQEIKNQDKWIITNIEDL